MGRGYLLFTLIRPASLDIFPDFQEFRHSSQTLPGPTPKVRDLMYLLEPQLVPRLPSVPTLVFMRRGFDSKSGIPLPVGNGLSVIEFVGA